MSRMVFCTKYQEELEGLDTPPLPGSKGQEIFDTISKKAWEEWLRHQTMLINEKQLNMMDIGARTYLSEQRDKFFNNEDYEQAEGYVPPNE
ncbi:oxidative damage protection protein [Candidatus Endobugula sertula]|uniref:Probable Fe(2+)-trafficking protein n=1 Tax=Candidatus Endobugula sertula TaxID=62101 RepID=A0A1D2QNU1_9GAMM|nr:oxidative damage protection protein [Candidatus Endobugula sertula]